MYSRSFSALTFAADFPPVAPEFHQRTHRVRLRNCVLAAIFMKTAKPEYSVYLTMAAGLFILAFAVGKFSYLYESLKKIQQYVPVDTTYMNILMKMIGITYIGQFSAGICKDAGYSAVAGQIEIYERLAVLAISMPILTALLETIHGFLG